MRANLIKFNLANTAIGLSYYLLATKYKFIDQKSATTQMVIYIASSLIFFMGKKWLNQSVSYIGMATLLSIPGFLYKMSWKVNLLSSVLLTTSIALIANTPVKSKSNPPSGSGFQSGDKFPSADISPTIKLTGVKDPQTNRNYAQLSITAPSAQSTAFNTPLHFVFCIDVSASMNTCERLEKVKTVLNRFTDLCVGLQNTSNRNIEATLITFSDKAKMFYNDSVAASTQQAWKNKIQQLNTENSTEIMPGIQEATKALSISTSDPIYSNLIFLIGGDDSNFNKKLSRLRELQNKWLQAKANILALGIGTDHKPAIMTALIQDEKNHQLPNAVYKFIPDEEPSVNSNSLNPSGVDLKTAVDLIFKAATQQIFTSIQIQAHPIEKVTILNPPIENNEFYELGGLSFDESITKYFLLEGQTNVNVVIKSQDFTGRTDTKTKSITIDQFSTREEKPQIFLEAVKQEILHIIGQIDALAKDKGQRGQFKQGTGIDAVIRKIKNVDEDFDELKRQLTSSITLVRASGEGTITQQTDRSRMLNPRKQI